MDVGAAKLYWNTICLPNVCLTRQRNLPQRDAPPHALPNHQQKISRGVPTTKGGPLEVYRRNDGRRQVLSRMPL